MIDAEGVVDEGVETDPSMEVVETAENEDLEVAVGEQRPKGGRITYYNRRQQLELVLAAQELSGTGGCEVEPTAEGKEVEIKGSDIWVDETCLVLLKEGMLPDMVELDEGKRAKKRAEHYCWKEQKLFFKGLYVPRPEERRSLVLQMHEDLGHSGEQRLLAEIRRRYFWHSRTEDVKSVVRNC
jgi:hypothetical protein